MNALAIAPARFQVVLNALWRLIASTRAIRVPRKSYVAWTAILALIFPLVVPLASTNPEIVLGAALESHGAPGTGDDAHSADRHDDNYSDVPGAPGHPLDHDCLPCQLLKYLAGFLPQPEFQSLPPGLRFSIAPDDRAEPQCHGCPASLPLSRAPPRSVI
jgi:hypothetical protein